MVFLALCAEALASDPVVIVEPPDGAIVPPHFTVKATYGDITVCDTGGCGIEPAEEALLVADTAEGKVLDQCWCVGAAEFNVMLAPGTYELTVRASYQFAIESSEPITVTVDAAATSGSADESTGSPSGSGSTSSTSGAGSDASDSDGTPAPDKGCGCAVDHVPTPELALLAISFLLMRRRRKAAVSHGLNRATHTPSVRPAASTT